jgi:NAD(P)-dependent dehydrogenase (short-subunit alcohol dehydrogenase family)
METGLRNQRILVTGASGGIGAATVRQLALEGAATVAHYSSHRAAAEDLLQSLDEPSRARSLTLRADLRDAEAVRQLFDDAVDALGGVDGLVVNAGVWPAQDLPIDQMPLDRWHDTLAVNLTGAFLCCRAFLARLRAAPRERASIVLVGSTAGLVGEEDHVDYAASKAALTGILFTAKNEIIRLAPRGRVNLVAPGWVDTPMSAESLQDSAQVARATSTMALRKVATAEDIAAAIVFLLSDRLAGHISGAIVPVHGGMEGRLLHPPGA